MLVLKTSMKPMIPPATECAVSLNANIAFCSFLRVGDDERDHDSKINADKVELRRLSNILFGFIRQAVREHRHGYPEGCPAPSDDAGLVRDDVFGR